MKCGTPLSDLKLQKAPGIDAIPAESLKNDVCVDLLYRIISVCFEKGIVPDQWKTGIVNPIVKPNSTDLRRPLTYRGITLISVPCKVYCDILNRRLSSWIEDSGIMADEQNGFRKNRSCQDHIYTLHSILSNRMNTNNSTFACFIDLKKAFDSVNRNCMWFKLKQLGIGGNFYSAVRSLYDNVRSCVQLNGLLTETFGIARGVKQGCLLSPTMFSIFINNLADVLRDANLGINVDDVIVNLLMYADDIVLLAESEENLQRMLDLVYEWCRKWRLEVNIAKTNIVHFRRKQVAATNALFKFGDQPLCFADKYKYLGFWFTEHLDMSFPVRELAKAASRAFGALATKYYAVGGLPYTVFTKLYESLIEPILFYCSGIWGHKEYRVVNNVQTRAMRLFLGVTKTTSNIGKQGDMGWKSCLAKQHIEVLRLHCKLKGAHQERILYKVHRWSSRRGRSWEANTQKLVRRYGLSDILRNVTNASKLVMTSIKTSVFQFHEQKWFTEMWNDRRCANGNKLRLYRKLKQDLLPEAYVTCTMPRAYRSALSKLRLGSLPLHVETGRYVHTPLQDRVCQHCRLDVED